MLKFAKSVSLVLCSGMLILSGCAQEQEVVKKDAPIVAPQKSIEKEKAQPPVEKPQSSAPAKEEAVESKPVTVAPVVKEETQTKKEQVEALFDAVYFDFDSSSLTPVSKEILSKYADQLLKKQPTLNIQIEGHCDERGSAEYNLALGERRAKSALSYLVNLGVKADRISTISYGKEKPADQGHDEAAWAKNRRAAFVTGK